MKFVLSSLQQARLHLDDPVRSPDLHSLVHELMQQLIDVMGFADSSASPAAPFDETWESAWLYELVEGLTETCFNLAESPADEAARALRLRLDRAIAGCRPS